MNKKTIFVRHPVASAIVLPILGLLWLNLTYMLVSTLPDNIQALLTALFSLLLLPIHKLIHKPDYRGSFAPGLLSDKRVWICSAIALAMSIADPVIAGIRSGFNSMDISYICNGIQAGCTEEVIFRVLPISVMMATWKDRKSSFPVLLITSLVFGLIHLTNLGSGAKLDITILQVFTAATSGLMYGALYLTTGNVLLPIILHALHDILSFWSLGEAAALTIDVTPDLLIEEGIIIAVKIILTVILMKNRNEHISAVWQERWSGNESDGSEENFEEV